jgi:signal transduction histidine kinase/ActR/RegA family two-component response regulator
MDATAVTDHRANILLVDDQPAKLLSYEAVLQELGENLISASSAEAALEQLLKNDVAVVLIDVCMPRLDGFELAGMIRGHPRFQKLPIIFVSAVNLSELDRLKGYESGAVDYVPVPVAPEILRAKVSVFAELHRKTRQLELLNRDLERRVADRTAELEASAERLRESEARLQETDRRKDEFLAMLGHELRNPLAPIQAAAKLLRMEHLAKSHHSRALDLVDRQVEHLVRLIDDLLDVSRITRGAITLRREMVNLAEVVNRAIETNRPLIDTKRHALIVELPTQSVYVDGDITRLTQVVGNLLHNAAKYTDDGGEIRVRVESNGPDAFLYVKDTGVGIPADMLSKVFDLFTQVERPLNRKQGGLGVGLAMVQRLVEMHGGTVSAQSDGIGRGTQVAVKLPLHVDVASSRVRKRRKDEAIIMHTIGRRILVVDDNRDAADSIALLLEVAGHDVRTAYDGPDALNVASEFRPEVVILDLGLPSMDGFEIARQIEGQTWGKDVTLVALTGWGQQEDYRRTSDAGFDAHLVKPVAPDELLKILEHAPSEQRPNAPTT